MSSKTQNVEAPHTAKPSSERRAAVRYRCLRDCVVRLEGATQGVSDWSGMTYDLSVIGVAFAILYPLALGTELIIEKFGPNRARVLRAKVVRSNPMEFVWLHGCQLQMPLTEAELNEWLK